MIDMHTSGRTRFRVQCLFSTTPFSGQTRGALKRCTRAEIGHARLTDRVPLGWMLIHSMPARRSRRAFNVGCVLVLSKPPVRVRGSMRASMRGSNERVESRWDVPAWLPFRVIAHTGARRRGRVVKGRTSIRGTEIGRACKTDLLGKCSYRRVDSVSSMFRRSRRCSNPRVGRACKTDLQSWSK